MEIKKDNSAPRKGMNRDTHPSELGKEEYTFAMNANVSDENGNGQVILQNDNSNIRCSGFKEGFRVIGHKYDQNRGRTYFFLKNTTTGCSEIGYIDMARAFEGTEAIEAECGCDFKVVLETPLEDKEQVGYCTYKTLIYDCCQRFPNAPKCLNFDINHPIHESNVELKDEKSGYNMYFTDFFNPTRSIKLDEIEYYYKDEEPCEDDEPTCLQCEKLKVFKSYDRPCLTPSKIESGGNLRAGTYEATLAYCTVDGTELSDYQVSTNQVPVFDQNNRVLSQPNLDYETNFSIEYEVENLDRRFKYFKIAIIRRNGLDGKITYHQLSVYPITTNRVTFATLDGASDINKNIINQRREIVKKTKGLASGNGYLFHYGLETNRLMNLQPVVSLMGSFAKWVAYQTLEDAYENGINVANYTGYMRDETYPFSIKFITDGGGESPLMPFVARPPRPDEIVEYVNLGGKMVQGGDNVQSIIDNVPKCESGGRRYKWQYENTATKDENCTVPSAIGVVDYTLLEEKTCTVSSGGEPTVVNTVSSGQVIVPGGSDLVNYINNNRATILADTDPSWAGVKAALSQEYPGQECTPTFGENCKDITLKENQIIAIRTSEEEQIDVPQKLKDYEEIGIPNSCTIIKTDTTTLEPKKHQIFITNYMNSGEVVFERTNVSNSSCSSAVDVLPPNPMSPGYHMLNKGQKLAFTTLITSKDATPSLPQFRDKLHSNAIWFRVDFSGRDKVILQMSKVSTCENPDDNNGSKIRLSAYTNCSGTHVPSYTEILDLPSTNIAIELDSSDFPSGEAFIAVDSEMYERTVGIELIYTLRPPCSCFAMSQTDQVTSKAVTFENLEFGKKQVYTSNCSYSQPSVDGCTPVVHSKGEFSYVESILKYPCNKELWDSRNLIIKESDIPAEHRSKFLAQYTTGTDGNGNLILSNEANFQDKPIRHYKFPSSEVSPFMNTNQPGDFKKSIIYPIGFHLDNEVITALLDVALNSGLITSEERQTITKYEIYRGSRTSQKSVVAKGVVFDYYTYKEQGAGSEGEDVFYPNYPLNTLGFDRMNGLKLTKFPEDWSNNLYAFHSPDTHFYKPTLPREIKLEGYQYGKSLNYYDEVTDHPRYAVIGKKAEKLAATLATAEVTFEAYLKLAEWFTQGFGSTYGTGTIESGIYIAIQVIAFATQAAFKWGRYREEWMQSFKKLGDPKQFAYYSVSIGTYSYMKNDVQTTSQIRGLASTQYVQEGKWKLNNKTGVAAINLNNTQRENHVMINTGAFNVTHPSGYTNYDNYNSNRPYSTRSEGIFGGTGKSHGYVRNTALPYISLKNNLPAQYGTIDSIDWLNTSYCGKLDEEQLSCAGVFGGDTYISRFSVKRKFPFFTATALGQPDNTPFEYSRYFNIQVPVGTDGKQELSDLMFRYYMNYEIDSTVEGGFIKKIFPTNQTNHKLDFPSTDAVFYERPPSKFYLYSYGIPHFLVESTYNCNFRYAGNSLAKDFYPHHNDVIELTQPVNVRIQEKEEFYFNQVYDLPRTLNTHSILAFDYERVRQDELVNLNNTVIWSERDASERGTFDPWTVYRTADSYDFNTSNGELTDITLIENEQMLARFKNGFSIFGTVDQIGDKFGKTSLELGTGGLFSGRNFNYYQTQLGYAGSQNSAMVSCKFGHFWADARRGKVFMMEPSGGSGGSFPKDITPGVEKWFKENLPYKIMQVTGFEERDADNAYNGVGITMGWDERSNRVFLTKRDYRPKVTGLRYVNNQFKDGATTVQLTDKEYFEDCSWTIAYNPLAQGWISYYSYKPNYYIGYNEYFQTGVTTTTGSSLWSHMPFESTYQVFYGKITPFTVEYPVLTKGAQSSFNSIEYWLDMRKYFNKHDFSSVNENGFNKAVVYNNDQNTGQIELIKQQNNNLSQLVNYPKHSVNSTEDLQTEISGKWNFNFLYNRLKDSRSGLPNWLYDSANVDKALNHKLIEYKNMYQDRLRGEYFLVRLTQDKNSRFKYIFRYAGDERNYYQQ